jgi:hypothetical protein
MKFGMPQGSVVGPTGFPSYSSPIGVICRKHGIQYHLYADDTQIYIAFSPSDIKNARWRLEACIKEVREWMNDNFLKLNDAKTEFLVIGTHHQLLSIPESPSVTIGSTNVSNSSSARNIGAIFDSNLLMDEHISKICQACYMYIRDIGKIRPYLTQDAAVKLVCAFVASKLDYLNSLLYGLPKHLIRRLKLIQHNAARIVTKSQKSAHITPILFSMHWLPVEFRIDYKIILLTFKSLHSLAPEYLTDLLEQYQPGRSLRSTNMNLLKEPASRTVK